MQLPIFNDPLYILCLLSPACYLLASSIRNVPCLCYRVLSIGLAHRCFHDVSIATLSSSSGLGECTCRWRLRVKHRRVVPVFRVYPRKNETRLPPLPPSTAGGAWKTIRNIDEPRRRRGKPFPLKHHPFFPTIQPSISECKPSYTGCPATGYLPFYEVGTAALFSL